MNRRALLWLIATVFLTIVGCLPRHPPHTPQPLGIKGETGGSIAIHQGVSHRTAGDGKILALFARLR